MVERLQAKLGPLPVWVWGVLLGAVVVAWFYWQQLKDNNGTTVSDTSSAATGDSSTSSYDAIDGAYSSSGASGSSLATDSAPESTDTNDAWYARALDALTGAGASSVEAQSALSHYLNGDELTDSDVALVNRATSIVKAPPTAVEITLASPVSWKRLANGDIQAIYSDGTAKTVSQAYWLAHGSPAFAVDDKAAADAAAEKAAADATAAAAAAAAAAAGQAIQYWYRLADGKIYVHLANGSNVFKGAAAWEAAGKPKFKTDGKAKKK